MLHACVPRAGPDGDTALHLACLYGHQACVEQLLAAGCAADVVNAEDGTSALHDAAAGGYLGIVQLLLSKAGSVLQLQVMPRARACVCGGGWDMS